MDPVVRSSTSGLDFQELPRETSSPISSGTIASESNSYSEGTNGVIDKEIADYLDHQSPADTVNQGNLDFKEGNYPHTPSKQIVPGNVDTIVEINNNINNDINTKNQSDDVIMNAKILGSGSLTPTSNPPTSNYRFLYNNHNELIFDDENLFPALSINSAIVKFDDVNTDLINHATLKALIVQLTLPEVIDYNLICDFFLTYRTFVSSVQVMNLLLTRLIWALQYINSQDMERNKIGKLVLLRTFVVLRHWLLNYFVDDFEPNSLICDLFSQQLNEITEYLNFLPNSPEMLFERKIISDLKIHWICQVKEFWGFNLEVDTLLMLSVIAYVLPLTSELHLNSKKLSKSATDMSIHTNPSYRRLAMLSLYDQKATHKCLIYDTTGNDENPQLLINNLLLQHKSLRASINLQIQVLQQKSKRDRETRQQNGNNGQNINNNNNNNNNINNNNSGINSGNGTRGHHIPTTSVKHNFISLQDSSIALKKTVKKEEDPNNIVNIMNNNSNENLNNFNINRNNDTLQTGLDGPPTITRQFTPASSVASSPKLQPSSMSATFFTTEISAPNGFSTNGNIKVPSLQVDGILPPTPVKKMEYTLKNDPLDSTAILMPPTHIDDNIEMNRKSSIKKILNGWRKTFAPPSGNSDFGSPNSPGTNLEFNYMISNALTGDDTDDDETVGSRVDVLSARIIDELEHLIRSYIANDLTPHTILEDHRDSLVNVKPIPTESRSKDELLFHQKEQNTENHLEQRDDLNDDNDDELPGANIDDDLFSNASNNNEELPEHNIDIGDLSDLNIVKIDNIINEGSMEEGGEMSKELSFQRPVSINWNDERNLEFDNSDSIIEMNHLSQISNQQSQTSMTDNEDEVGIEVVDLDTNKSHRYSSSSKNFGIDGIEVEATPIDKKKLSVQLTIENCAGHQGEVGMEIESSSYDSLFKNKTDPYIESRSNRIQKSSTQYFDVSSEFEVDNAPLNDSFNSSISTPSNITQYNADVVELGILNTPQVKNAVNNQHSQQKRISFNEANINYNQKRLSIVSRTSSSSIFKRDSVKSYISYDSVFSSSNGSAKNNTGHTNAPSENAGFLRKKAGFQNLRESDNNKNSPTKSNTRSSALRDSYGSHTSNLSRSSSTRKSIRLSTLCTLTELPFHFFEESSLESTNIQRSANSIIHDNSPERKSENRDNVLANKRSMKSSKLLEVCDSSIFSVAIKSRKHSRKEKISNSSSSNSEAIPGISTCILKELAAIPDESFRFSNPVDTALEKLEGKGKIVPTKNVGDDTQEILDEINNARTLDVIDLDDSLEITQELPLTPLAKGSNIFNSGHDSLRNSNVELSELQCSTPMVEQQENNSTRELGQLTKNKSTSTNYFFEKPEFTKEQNQGYLTPRERLEKYAISSDSLCVEKVLQSNHHVSFVLSYDSQTLAQHFTVIEQDILQEIDWKELIELKWTKELEPVNSWLEVIVNESYFNQNKGVNLVISRFNLMVNWIISQILLTKKMHERIHIISRFIHIAQNCLVLQNFATLMQIVLGLTSEKVSKLKETWKNLPPGDILMLKNLEEIGSPLKNFLNIRLCINHMTPSKGCIPFVGLYLSDLIFNAERPAFIKPTNANTLIDTQELDEEKFINFSRFRTSVHIVKSLSQCIEWSSRYDINVKPELLSRCLYVRSLDEDEMNYCLKEIDERVEAGEVK